jgi:hypothetical protein
MRFGFTPAVNDIFALTSALTFILVAVSQWLASQAGW